MAEHNFVSSGESDDSFCIKCSVRSYQGIPIECTEKFGYPWGGNSALNPHITAKMLAIKYKDVPMKLPTVNERYI